MTDRTDGDQHRDGKPSPAEQRRSERIVRANLIEPRGLTKGDAAAYCGCRTEDAFDDWVRKGIVPEPIPGTQRWDRKAIDWWLDKASQSGDRNAGKRPGGLEGLAGKALDLIN